MPCRTRTGIEQHTDDGKIDPGAGARRRIAARQCAIELGGAIDATCLEMTPAAVIGNVQIGIAATRHGVHACGCEGTGQSRMVASYAAMYSASPCGVLNAVAMINLPCLVVVSPRVAATASARTT